MSYPKEIKHGVPEINLPYPKTVKELIFSFYEISGDEGDPRKIAKCLECEDEICMISGSNVYSSYTSGLTCHLQKHTEQWTTYLELLKDCLTPDNKSVNEHYQAMSRVYKGHTNREEYGIRECDRNYNMNRRNCADIFYIRRDCEVLKNKLSAEYQNAKMFAYLHPYTNRNVPLFDLIGTKHPSAKLNRSYKKSKCLVDNDGDITLDLEKLFCENVCFFDPSFYDDCHLQHTGDISIFGDENFQARFQGFKQEIEKYPEFQINKSFNSDVLKDKTLIEHDTTAVREMNRLLKIILSILVVYKTTINEKISQMVDHGMDNNLRKPELGVQLWGPKCENLDKEEDESVLYSESEFSTFLHVNNEDCPAYDNPSVDKSKTANFHNNIAFYPCNFGCCLQRCSCTPCNDDQGRYQEPNSFKCDDHNPDHPEMFDEDDDLAIKRRKYFHAGSKKPIFKRPKNHTELCPPKIKLAGMKKECKKCRTILDDHRRNHHILHHVCQICCHMERMSKVSFNLTCYLCLRLFKNKYRLADHMLTHDDDNPFFCVACKKGFTRKFTYEQHILSNHSDSKEDHVCSSCKINFSSSANLNRHIKTKHQTTQEDYSCNLCDKKFKRHDTLFRHERVDHNLKRNETIIPGINDEKDCFKCNFCDEIFSYKFTLKRHIEDIHAMKTYSCNMCAKTFKRKDELQIHIQVHNVTLNRIVCEICREEFPGKPQLREHRLKIHEN